jgi:hypothetical protein
MTNPLIFGLLYTHHKVPDKVLAAMLNSVRTAGLPDRQLMIVSNGRDARFPKDCWHICNNNALTLKIRGWEAAILEQMAVGLGWLPTGAVVCFLEHDVLYPVDYFKTVAEQSIVPGRTYFYGCYRHLDLHPGPDPAYSGFWCGHEGGLCCAASGISGDRQTLLNRVRDKQDEVRRGNIRITYEPGINGPMEVLSHDLATGQELVSLLDIRHGANTSNFGYHNQAAHHAALHHAYWGSAAILRQALNG